MIYKDAQFEELANKIRLGGMTRNEMHVTRENQRRLLKLGY